MRYENLTAILTKAIQEIATISGAFRADLTAFLADATNGIHDLYTDAIHAKKQLCVADVCVTRDQFLRMVQQSEGGASGQGTAPAISASPESELAGEEVSNPCRGA